MNDREWEKQDLEARIRLALSGADRARWDSLNAKGLLPSRVARKLAGLKYLVGRKDPLADYDAEISAAFRAPFDAGAEETPETEAAVAVSTEDIRPGLTPLRRKRKERRRLFRR